MTFQFAEAPFGHIPILSVDGTEVCGSVNIARFVAERHGKVLRYDSTIMPYPAYLYNRIGRRQ